jgi:hypothetical protein
MADARPRPAEQRRDPLRSWCHEQEGVAVGSAVATAFKPMVLPPPGGFSTMTVPKVAFSFRLHQRHDRRSACLANGTISLSACWIRLRSGRRRRRARSKRRIQCGSCTPFLFSPPLVGGPGWGRRGTEGQHCTPLTSQPSQRDHKGEYLAWAITPAYRRRGTSGWSSAPPRRERRNPPACRLASAALLEAIVASASRYDLGIELVDDLARVRGATMPVELAMKSAPLPIMVGTSMVPQPSRSRVRAPCLHARG